MFLHTLKKISQIFFSLHAYKKILRKKKVFYTQKKDFSEFFLFFYTHINNFPEKKIFFYTHIKDFSEKKIFFLHTHK